MICPRVINLVFRRRLQRAAHWLLCLVVVGCSSPTLRTPGEVLLDPESLQHWQAQGKMALRGPDQGHNLSFTWIQKGADFTLDLSGPFGMGKLKIMGSKGVLHTMTRGDDIIDHTEARLLLLQETGWDMPLALLPHWFRGLPAPAYASTDERYASDKLQALGQNNWQIQWGDYRPRSLAFGAYLLPHSLTMTRDEYRARFKILQWRPPPASS